MARVRSGALVVMLLGGCVYASCSSDASSDEGGGPDGAGGAAGDGTGLGGNAGSSLGGSAGGGRTGGGGQADGGEAGDTTGTAGDASGGDSGGTRSTGGNTTGGSGSGGTSTGGGGGSGGTGGSGGPITCGNGRIDAGESCDDGERVSSDGCSAACLIEDGYDCQGAPSVCRRTTCGNATIERGEACDDGNILPFDGCTPDCRLEPSCTSGMACTSPCGDGIVHGGEECDDGNRRNGDGCSSTCMVESGFVCDLEAPCETRNGACTIELPIVFRDFNHAGVAGGHPDFQPNFNNQGVIPGLVESRLDDAGKPVLSSTASVANGFMHGAQSFAQWFRNGAPASAPIPQKLVLWDDGSGGFVNRWGANGERFIAYQTPTFCSTTDCSACAAAPSGTVCRAPCPPWGYDACFVTEVPYDGSPLFFPIDAAPGLLTDMRTPARVPEQYGWAGWPLETAVAMTLGVTTPVQTSTSPFPTAVHNFHFTSEARFWFEYDAGTTQRIAFTGDDDAWVFVNGRLAIDLGGWHVPIGGSVTLDATTYSLSAGGLYEVAVFHAERETDGSSFRLGHSGMTLPRSRCRAR